MPSSPAAASTMLPLPLSWATAPWSLGATPQTEATVSNAGCCPEQGATVGHEENQIHQTVRIMHMCIYIYVSLLTHASTSTSTFTFTFTFTFPHMHLHMHMRICICICICVCIGICVCRSEDIFMCTRTHLLSAAYTCIWHPTCSRSYRRTMLSRY